MPSFAAVELQTHRLLMRPLRASDTADLFAAFSDPEVMRYWSSPPWKSMAEAERLVAQGESDMAAGKHLRLGVQLMSSDRVIGTCSLFDFSEQCRRAEVGYGLARAAWGCGYMHEALVALLSHGFSELALNRVEADIDPRNVASAASLRRLGFTKEGHLRERWIVNGEVSDSALYGLLQSDWRTGGSSATPPPA